MREDSLENLQRLEYSKGMRDRGKYRIVYLTSLCICLAENVLGQIKNGQTLLRDTRTE